MLKYNATIWNIRNVCNVCVKSIFTWKNRNDTRTSTKYIILDILVIFITDNIVSSIVMRYIKTTEKTAYKELDNTEEITKKSKRAINKQICIA